MRDAFNGHGYNGIRAWFEDTDEMFSQVHVQLEHFREVGDRLLVLGQMSAEREAQEAAR